MNFTMAQLAPYLVSFSLILIRCLGVGMMVPVIGGDLVPLRIRGAFMVALAVVLTPMFHLLIKVEPVFLVQAGIGELLIGVIMSLVVRMILSSAEMAGELTGMQMGLSFAQMVDPMTSENNEVIGRLLGIIAGLLFIAIDGPHMVITGLAHSLKVAPPGTVFDQFSGAQTLIGLLSIVVVSAVRISAPVVAVLLLTNVALALLARAAPQFNLFAMSFAIAIGMGLIVLSTATGTSLIVLINQMRQIPDVMADALVN